MRHLASSLVLSLLLCAPAAPAAAEPIGALIKRAEKLYEKNDHRAGLRTSLAIINRADAKEIQRARAFLYVGVFYTELGRHTQAVNAFLELLRYRPRFRLPPSVKGVRASYPRIQQNFRAALAALSSKRGGAVRPRVRSVVAAMFSIDMQGVPHTPGLKRRLQTYLHAQLAARGHYRLVATKRLAAAIRSLRKESYKPCYARACQVAIGQQLAAQAAINTMLFRIGRRCLGTITLYDLRSGTTRSAATAEGSCSAGGLLGIVKQLADRLGG